MKHFTMKFLSLMLFTCVSFVSYGQYCTGGPTNTADSNLESFDLFGANGSCINYTGCSGTSGVIGLEDLTLTTNANLVQGTTASADVVWGTCGGNFGNAGTIWIDWDQNSTFDASEAIHTWSGTPVVAQTISITVPMTATLGATRLRIFQMEGGTIPMNACGTSTWGSMTDFTVTITAAGTYCNPPTGISVATAGNDATVAFVTNAGATSTNIEYGPAGFTPGTGTTITGVTSPHTINNLASSTQYDVHVIDVCGAAMSCPAIESFLTPCALFTIPYTTSFEGNINCWTQYTTDDFDWTLHSGVTTSALGPSAASDGNEYLYTEVSSVSNGDQAIIESPELLLIGAPNPAMIFDYHMYGDNAMGTMSVEIDSALTGNWISIWSRSGNQDDVWHLAEVSLAGYGDTVAVRIVGSTLGCCSGDMAFDYVRFLPDYCFNSYDVDVYALPSSAIVSFSSLNNVVSMEYGFSGFAPGTGTTVNNITSPYTITPIAPNTDYDVVLYDSCGANISDGTLVSFTTPCAAAIAPYTEGFEGTGYETCWIEESEDDMIWLQNTGATGTGNTGPTAASEGSEYLHIDVNFPSAIGDVAVLTTQYVNVSTLSAPALRFDYHMFGNQIGTLEVQVDSAQTGNWVTIWQKSGDQGNEWITGLSPLADYGNTVRVRFIANSAGCCEGDIAIDFVRFEEYCIPVETAPFVEGFEYGCYDQSTMDGFDWTISSMPSPTTGTGAGSPTEGNSYAFTESGDGVAGDSAIFMTQYVNLMNLTYPELTFDYHMWDSTYAEMGALKVEISHDMGATWSPVWSISGNQGNEWHQGQVNLIEAGVTDTVGVRFSGTLGGATSSDISLDNIRIDDGSEIDLAITDVFSDFSSCASPGNPVAFEITNTGFTPVADFFYGVIINGVQIFQVHSDTIHPDETKLVGLNNGIDLMPGANNLEYAVDGFSYGDMNSSNDLISDVVMASGYENGDNYTNDYESGMSGWRGTGDWALGAPTGTVINAAAGGAASWVTNLGGNYSHGEESYLYSPCFDFSDYISDPVVSFDINWDVTADNDGAYLEMSTDGVTWMQVGMMGSGTNWYNVTGGWQGTGASGSGGWINASTRVMGTAGASSVQFRFSMSSDLNTQGEGVGIDNFAINDWCPINLGLGTNVFPSTAGTVGDAGAIVTPTDGTGPYTYLWSNGATTQTVDTLMGNAVYSVTVTDANGCSDIASVSTTVVSDDFISSMQNLDIFPNPAQNTANVAVSFEQAVDVEVELVNIVGQILTSNRKEGLTQGNFTFDLASYPAGVYLVRIKANNESVTRRLVITK